MFVLDRAKRAAMARWRPPLRGGVLWLAALASAALASACTALPQSPTAGPDPSDPFAPSRPVSYRSTITPYASQRPVEPKPWEQQNERVGPSQRP